MGSAFVAGGTGLLGHALLEAAPAGWQLRASYHERLPPVGWRSRFVAMDVCDDRQVREAIAACAPSVVIHTASIGSVDLAERDPEGVRRINIGGLQSVARACDETGALLVFISSNAVFDGASPPYAETAPRHAVNKYGALKIEAEQWLEASGLPHMIIRPILMYGWPLDGGRSNAVSRWVAEFEIGRRVQAAEDVHSMPLFVGDAATAIWAAIERQRSGVYHLAGGDRVTLAQFARETARVFGFSEELVEAVRSAWFTSLAPRPLDTSFVTTKMERELGVHPRGIRQGLTEMQRTRVRSR